MAQAVYKALRFEGYMEPGKVWESATYWGILTAILLKKRIVWFENPERAMYWMIVAAEELRRSLVWQFRILDDHLSLLSVAETATK
jgi:hypothetical protein